MSTEPSIVIDLPFQPTTMQQKEFQLVSTRKRVPCCMVSLTRNPTVNIFCCLGCASSIRLYKVRLSSFKGTKYERSRLQISYLISFDVCLKGIYLTRSKCEVHDSTLLLFIYLFIYS